jgi:hypothetical protein
MSRQIEHWDCGDVSELEKSVEPIANTVTKSLAAEQLTEMFEQLASDVLQDFIEQRLLDFVDQNVYEALKEYGSTASLQIPDPNGKDPDAVYIYIADPRADDYDENGERQAIGTVCSLKEAIFEGSEQGGIAPLVMAEHLESIAKELRRRANDGRRS